MPRLFGMVHAVDVEIRYIRRQPSHTQTYEPNVPGVGLPWVQGCKGDTHNSGHLNHAITGISVYTAGRHQRSSGLVHTQTIRNKGPRYQPGGKK